MELLLKKVKKELDTIADKGITSSNLEVTNKLVDIYKDLKEICQIDEDSYNGRNVFINRSGEGRNKNYDRHWDYPDERTERYLTRMKEGMTDYNEGRNRYRDGGSDSRMIDGIEMTMNAVVGFVESLMDYAETSQEKEVVRKYLNRIKNV